jgi:hypothetical protein
MSKPILCLDFDGVIHSYSSGWQGAGVANDPPVAGTLEFLHEATKHFRVMLYSSRSKSFAGRRAMRRYMREHFYLPLTFSPDHHHDFLHEAIGYPWFKPSAFITIDDRALTFTGNWSDFAPPTLKAFRPWNKRVRDSGSDAQRGDAFAAPSEGSQSGPNVDSGIAQTGPSHD